MPAERPLTVLEAITMAGGFTDLASPDRTKVLRNANGQNQSAGGVYSPDRAHAGRRRE